MADEQEKVNQFALPHGLTGRLAGRLMAVVNADMERAAVSALDLEGDERVLEVGFGPGVGIRLLSGRLPRGAVEGIDPSGVMLTQAVRRNRKAVAQGRVELRLGTSAHLPWPDGRFDAVVSVNNVQEWPSLGSDLAEVRRVLEEHGQLSLAVHEWVAKHARDRGDEDRPYAEHLVTALERAGFRGVEGTRRRARSGRALYFTARR